MNTGSLETMLVGLFAITSPIAILPIFVAATAGQNGTQQRKTALIATATYLVVALLALFVGNAMLSFFGISVSALRVAGMAIVAVIGWKMLNAPTPSDGGADGEASGGLPGLGTGSKPTRHHLHTASNTKIAIANPARTGAAPSPVGVGLMPLGFPIYAGPGVISVIIAWGSGAKSVYIAALVAILANAAIILALDFLATPITRLIGEKGLLVTEKVFGLIVVAIAVAGMAGALLVLFPGLAKTGP
jgi:multiple antibiotic resistance protein